MAIEHTHWCFKHNRFPKRVKFYGSSWLRYTGEAGKTTQFRVYLCNGNVLNFCYGRRGIVPIDGHFP